MECIAIYPPSALTSAVFSSKSRTNTNCTVALLALLVLLSLLVASTLSKPGPQNTPGASKEIRSRWRILCDQVQQQSPTTPKGTDIESYKLRRHWHGPDTSPSTNEDIRDMRGPPH